MRATQGEVLWQLEELGGISQRRRSALVRASQRGGPGVQCGFEELQQLGLEQTRRAVLAQACVSCRAPPTLVPHALAGGCWVGVVASVAGERAFRRIRLRSTVVVAGVRRRGRQAARGLAPRSRSRAPPLARVFAGGHRRRAAACDGPILWAVKCGSAHVSLPVADARSYQDSRSV